MPKRQDYRFICPFNKMINKIYDKNIDNPIFVTIKDKIAAKGYIKDKIDSGYTFDMLAVDRDLNKVITKTVENNTGEFFVKLNKYSGCNARVNKNTLIGVTKSISNKKVSQAKFLKEISRIRKKPASWTKCWEWAKIPDLFFTEPFIPGELFDYKAYCYKGKPIFIQCVSVQGKSRTENVYDLNGNELDFQMVNPRRDKPTALPKNWNKIVDIAKILAIDFEFIRIDMFYVNDKVYVGELETKPRSGNFQFLNHSKKAYEMMLRGSSISLIC